MSLFKRLEGIFTQPKQVFQFLAEKPLWIDALIVVVVLVAVFSHWTAPYSQNDQIQLLKDNVKLKERMGETRYNTMMERLETAPSSGALVKTIVAVPLMTVLGFLFSSLILLIMGRFVSAQGNYVQILAAVIHVSVIDKLLGNAVRFVLISARKSVMQISASPALLFPGMEATSSAYIVLAQMDFFQLWMFGILAFGMAFIFKINLKKALIISFGFWLLKSLVFIGLGIIGMHYLK